MNYTQPQDAEDARARLENQIEEGQRFLEVTSLPTLVAIQSFQEKICEWRNGAYALLEEIYDHQSVQSAYCPTIEKSDFDVEMRNEARNKLNAEVSTILDSLRDFLSKCN